nr:hypothetical protein [uncultured Moellerella sp.]
MKHTKLSLITLLTVFFIGYVHAECDANIDITNINNSIIFNLNPINGPVKTMEEKGVKQGRNNISEINENKENYIIIKYDKCKGFIDYKSKYKTIISDEEYNELFITLKRVKNKFLYNSVNADISLIKDEKNKFMPIKTNEWDMKMTFFLDDLGVVTHGEGTAYYNNQFITNLKMKLNYQDGKLVEVINESNYYRFSNTKLINWDEENRLSQTLTKSKNIQYTEDFDYDGNKNVGYKKVSDEKEYVFESKMTCNLWDKYGNCTEREFEKKKIDYSQSKEGTIIFSKRIVFEPKYTYHE